MKKTLCFSVVMLLLLLSCVQQPGNGNRNNPFDTQGENWHPPTVTAMADTTVAINDLVPLHATGTDSVGTVVKFLWARDAKNFKDTTDDSIFATSFTVPGKDTVTVVAVDNDGVKSPSADTIMIYVHSYAPTVLAGPKNKIIGIGDSVKINASARDTNGSIVGIYWALDGTNFSTAKGDSFIVFKGTSQGTKKVLVKAVDDDTLATVDSVTIFVKDKAPLIYAPVDGAVLQYNSTSLKWYPGFYNSSFKVMLDTVNPPKAVALAATRDSSYAASNLALNKKYYWFVIGYNAQGAADTSQTWSFTTGNGPAVPTSGLVAYYPFNGNAKDESGNGNDGAVNGAMLTTDRFGDANKAYSFDGISGHIDVASSTSLTFSNSFSLVTWIKVQSLPQTYNNILNKYYDGSEPDRGFVIELVDSGYINFSSSRDISLHKSLSNPLDGKWHCISGTWDGLHANIYYDGVLTTSTSWAGPFTNQNIQMGIGYDPNTGAGPGNYFNGLIDDIRIYNRALSGQEIQALYQEGGYVPPLSKPFLSAWGSDSTTIKAQWNSQSGATGYTLQSASSSTGPFSQIYSGSDTTYTNSGLTTNQKAWYRAQATNATQTSEWSDTVGAVANGTVIDVDGNVYHTVAIGTQVWMVENLKTTKHNDGAAIPLVTDGTAWAALAAPGYCWFYNDSSSNKNTYGALYNWYTVNTGKLAPTGWHVPTDSEWSVLTTYLGGESVAGGKLKEAGTAHWNSPNTGATNEIGFSALPAGCRLPTGSFYEVDHFSGWWTSTVADATNSWGRYVAYNLALVDRSTSSKKQGFSVRCVRD
jgi:uncharacterized protein (TIGR02145 family)